MRRGNIKRTLSSMLAAALLLTLLPMEALAAEPSQEENAVCICTAACTDGAVNEDCPVCAIDAAQCIGTSVAAPAPTADGTPAPYGAEDNSTQTVFKKLELRADKAEGALVADLLAVDGADWKSVIAPLSDYYLCVELAPGAHKYVQLRYGNNNETCNGVSFANPIGGSQMQVGAVDHSYFDKLTARKDFPNPTYGFTKIGEDTPNSLSVADGTVVYHIKEDNTSETISFAMGMVMLGALYDGTNALEDAFSVAVGDYDSDTNTFTAAEERTIDLKLADKKKAISRVVNISASAELGGAGTPQQIYVFGNKESETGIEMLYDSISFDVTYPANAEINDYGFNTNFDKKSTSYGTVTLSEKSNNNATKTSTFTISKGYKPKSGTVGLYYRLSFPANVGFDDAPYDGTTYTFKISNFNALMVGDKKIETELYQSGTTTYDTTTYTLSEAGTDSTKLVKGTDRPVYNHSLDMAIDQGNPYIVPLGSATLSNTNGSSATPYEKTYEATFNTTRASAKITAITVPLGTYRSAEQYPKIVVEGKDTSGAEKKVTLSDAQIVAAANVKGKDGKIDDSATYLLIFASALDLDEITKVTAEIGKLPASYVSSSWTSGWGFAYNRVGVYGYFTEGAADRASGIQVKNTFRVYNTDPALRDRNNGDLSVVSTITSTDERRLGMNAPTPKLYSLTPGNETRTNLGALNASSAVEAGKTAIITGSLYPYVAADAARAETGVVATQATTTLLKAPVLYLAVPLGLTPDTSNFKFYINRYNQYDVVQSSESYGSNNPLEYEWAAMGRSAVNGTEVELYRITLPADTLLGYYDAQGYSYQLFYDLAFQTDKSLPTQRYRLNDLVIFTVDGGAIAVPYNGMNNTTQVYVQQDRYGINNGAMVHGVTKDNDDGPIGFGVQQQAEVTVDSAISVSKINGTAVTPQWNSYSASNPNSIALLGQKSEGQVRLRVTNTSDLASKDLALVLPIPKQDTNLGALFMDEKQGFSMNVTIAGENPDEFAVQYIKLKKTEDGSTPTFADTTAFFGENGEDTPYEIVATDSDADALLITAESLAKGEYDLFFNFSIDVGAANAQNIWRPAYVYTVSNEHRQRVGGYVASAVAPHSIDGTVFEDTDRNGVQGDNEPGVAGISIRAQDLQGRTETVTTDENGHYQFVAVRETTVTLTFSVDQSKTLRFNIDPPTGSPAGVVSSVKPVAGGMSATTTVEAGGTSAEGGTVSSAKATQVNAAMGSFYTLTYSGNGSSAGSPPPSQERTPGDSVTVSAKPDALQKTGCRFVKWNTKADGSGTDYAPGSVFTMTGDTTLYAVWEKATYTITFNYRGATGQIGDTTRTIQNGDKYTDLPDPIKNGYEFVGWSTSATATTANVTNGSTCGLSADTTLYAVWKAKTGYTVNYDLGYEGGTPPTEKTVAWTDYRLLPTAPTRTGYDFAGWQYGLTAVDFYTTYGSLAVNDTVMEVTLVAQWMPKSGYTVTYNLNYEDEEPATDKPTDKSVTWTTANLLPTTTPTRENYVLAGWTTTKEPTPEGEPTYVTADQTYGALAGDDDSTENPLTLYAQWTEVNASNCIVQYDAQGGTPVADKVLESSGSTGLLPDVTTTRPGYTLDGWYTENETQVNEDTTFASVTGDNGGNTVTLYAHWTPIEYTVQYDLNYTSDPQPEPPTAKTGVTWEATDLLPDGTVTREGYTLLGWYTAANGGTKVEESTVFSAIAPSDVSAREVTLYALWSELTYTVYYDSQGGGTLNPKTNVPYRSTNYLPDITPTKLGYKLSGWNCGTVAVDQKDMQTIGVLSKATGATVQEQTITLTAQWEPKDFFTVKYNTGSETAISDKTNVKWMDTKLLPSDEEKPTRAGYEFAGWTSDRVSVVTNDTVYSSLAADDAEGSSVTLVAKWTPKSDYVVNYETEYGGSIEPKSNVSWTQAALLPSVSLHETGYIVSGWKLQGTDTLVKPADTFAALAGNDASVTSITLVAVWVKSTAYSVVYELNGGQLTEGTGKTNLEYWSAGLIPEVAPTRPGHSFGGWWYNDTQEVTLSTTYDTLAGSDTVKTLTLEAHWTPKSYTVVYDTNGGGTIPNGTVQWEDPVLPANPPTKLGHKLTGWVMSGESKAQVAADTKLSALLPQDNADTVTLQAQWEERTYTVKYDTGAGSKINARAGVQYNSSVMPNTAPTWDGHFLQGWTYNGKEVAYNATCAQMLGDQANSVTELTLTAVYILTPTASGTVNGTVVNGENLKQQDVSVTLKLGGTEGQTVAGPVTTNGDGSFTFEKVPYGIYTLVATQTKDGATQTITKSLVVNAETVSSKITMPSGKQNTYVVVQGAMESGAQLSAAAEGLDALLEKPVTVDTTGVTEADQTAVAEGKADLYLTLTITPETVEAVQADVAKIEAAATVSAGATATVLPYDLSMYKTLTETGTTPKDTTTKLTSVPALVQIILPVPKAAGKKFQVLRVHNGAAESLPEASTVDESAERYSYQNGILTLYVQKFSTYAVVYETITNNGGSGNGGSGGSGGGAGGSSGGTAGGGNTAAAETTVTDPNVTGVAAWLEIDAHIAYLQGHNTGYFEPNGSMTRAQAAQMFYNLLKNKEVATDAQFADIPAGAWYEKAADTLASLGIMTGVGENRFAPTRAITRAEFTAAAMRFATLRTDGVKSFSDVHVGDWYYDQVRGATKYGWISGYEDGTFRPNDTITRAEVATIVNRMLDRSADTAFIDGSVSRLTAFPDVSASHWAYYNIMEATNAHSYTHTGGKENWSMP